MAKAKITKKAVTKKTAVKTVAKKAVAKKTTAKKTAPKKIVKKAAGMKEGNRYACRVCGLAVVVDTECGCAETSHLICCESPMRLKR